MAAPAELQRLVDTFDRNRDTYRAGGIGETEARVQFIDPLFELFGWDMRNTRGYAESFKDVVHEDAVKIDGFTKAPDYCFRVGGQRVFFLEAKKPSVNLKDDTVPAFQLRRYAWSAKLPLSILTDFEELAVYDCRRKPDKKDAAAVARLTYLHYQDYAAHWDELCAVFSKEAVLQGSFHKYAEATKGKKGTTEVDAAFLEEISNWRDVLARTIALRNPSLSQCELNFAVQKTIDRIVFLRMCEDRGIEPHGQLLALTNGAHIYPRLVELFVKADQRYNSGLFHFNVAPASRRHGIAAETAALPESADDLTPRLVLDDKPLKDIFQNLYYPDCPYQFSVLPIQILGDVYEQFLGKVIRLTAGHQAKIEEKPEVKKAGGVKYTPAFVTANIVKNTVGALIEKIVDDCGNAIKDAGKLYTTVLAAVAALKICDPACGSGSFLIAAYQYLLDWYLQWHVQHEALALKMKPAPIYIVGSKGEAARVQGSGFGITATPDLSPTEAPMHRCTGAPNFRLTTAEKKRILLNNIFGVDIDGQAVEVTKLSLLLKVLEGENQDTLERQLSLFHERALPDLSSNIKCGNSLIGPEFYEHQQMTLLNDDERRRINVFDWHAAFPQVFRSAGV
ncbi:MAG: restriction endonuclease subunit M, partial [bacterium]|nr:restriction endonuclease subunit M [bacterium]